MLENILFITSFLLINSKYYYIYLILQIFSEALLYGSNAILSTVYIKEDTSDRDPDLE